MRRYEVLENYYLLQTRNKANSDKAMQSFIAMLEHDNDYLPAVLGMATGFMMEKNQVSIHGNHFFIPCCRGCIIYSSHHLHWFMYCSQHKARNLLKRVGTMEMSVADGEDYEKANLLLAKFYVDKVRRTLHCFLSFGSQC